MTVLIKQILFIHENLIKKIGIKMKLNLGCGKKTLKGYHNVDVADVYPAEQFVRHHDLNKFPYPFPEGEHSEILMDNSLEHLDDWVKVVCECHRLLDKGGKLIIKTPYRTHPASWNEPSHKHHFDEGNFIFF
jgi:predicted SAM-dependent methyltransferase